MSGSEVALPRSAPVLHPTDLHEGARAAFPYALYLAALAEGDLHALHVAESPDAGPTAGDFPDPDAAWSRVSGWLAGRGSSPPGGSGAPETPEFHAEIRRDGEPAGEILRYASEIGAWAICMGTDARRGLRRLVLGSVAEHVVRSSPVPVLTVARGLAGWGEGGPGRILVPVDLSAMTEPALLWAGTLAAATGCGLTALHVVESPAGAATRGNRQRVFRAYRDLPAPDVDLDVSVVAGDPVSRICGMAEELGADLVVPATHGRSGSSRIVLGSVAEAVVRRAPCPVLTISDPPPGTPDGGDDR